MPSSSGSCEKAFSENKLDENESLSRSLVYKKVVFTLKSFSHLVSYKSVLSLSDHDDYFVLRQRRSSRSS